MTHSGGLQSWAEEERGLRRRCREERAELVASVERLSGWGGGEEAVQRRVWSEERAVCATAPTPLTPTPNPQLCFLQSLAKAKRDALRMRREVEDVPSHPDLMQ